MLENNDPTHPSIVTMAAVKAKAAPKDGQDGEHKASSSSSLEWILDAYRSLEPRVSCVDIDV